jgi:hypothetical protein
MAHRHFVFENCGFLASACVKHTVVLDIASVADTNVVHISPEHRVTPDGRLLAKMYIANYLSAFVDVCALGNLRVNTAKWPNHIFAP